VLHRLYQVGDKVVSISHSGGIAPETLGTVRHGQVAAGDMVGVEWPGFAAGHDLGGSLKGSKDNSGWYVASATLKLTEEAFNPQFPVGTRVRLTTTHDAAKGGKVGTVAFIKSDVSYQPYGVSFDNWKGGHGLRTGDFVLPKGKELTGHWVPEGKLELVVSKPRVPKLGDKVTITKDFDAAKLAMTGTVVLVPKGFGSQSYGLKLKELDGRNGGHTLGGALVTSDGQWVPKENFQVTKRAYVRKPKAPKPVAPVPEAPKPKPTWDVDLPRTKSVGVRLLKETKLQDGKAIAAGSYWGQAVLVSMRPTILVSFGYGQVLVFEASDERIVVTP